MTLEQLKDIKEKTDAGLLPKPADTVYVNNHIHTTYSFSPYSPTKALYMAWQNGLKTAGIMDHDSVGGAKEFLAAAEVIGMPVTCGVECRVDMSKTVLCGKRINNPDQISVAYVAMHGIPHQNIDAVQEFFAPYREKRNARNRKMCANITALVAPYGLSLDFDADVLPISNYALGGSVTERHILFALTKKITARYKTPEEVIAFLRDEMKLSLSDKVKGQILAGRDTPDFYEYDILGALKSNMVEKIYVDATDECPDVRDFIEMVHQNGGIAAYAYLGDVGDSVTGDKKAQKFEDDYLDLLVKVLRELKFDAITYMPTRNTLAQLQRLMKLCKENGFFEISGEDINSPRQSFICRALDDPNFGHLIDATYTLIHYENAASLDLEKAKADFSHIFAK
ncbi:MAG: PHP domain-containing protein [Clostridia bacterium]|nr:PHP domain-containing protein [Clostridia bacterium]